MHNKIFEEQGFRDVSRGEAIFMALIREDMKKADRDHYLDRIRKQSGGLTAIKEAMVYADTKGRGYTSNYDLLVRVDQDLEDAVNRSQLEYNLGVNLSIHSPQMKR